MKIVRYSDPKNLVPGTFNNFMDDLFSEFLSNTFEKVPYAGIYPKVDIEENENSYLIKAELPGIKKEDVSIDIDNRVLTISGEKKEVVEEKGKNVFRKESYSGSFSRSFTLPEHVSPDDADAKYENGILTLVLPKNNDKIRKKIDIK
ncbi:MAG TPA: Hsp20/alpha crystallin family protein [bacterium]|nr:Hsp20/alpha crystallin family protein [bacterium]HPS30185.1 Hsp20/alpha crystallin family protein [bacterium]